MKILEIERLRGLAIAMVVWHHWPLLNQYGFPAAVSSWTGVDLFFVISGFVVTRSLLKALPDNTGKSQFIERLENSVPALKTFFKRRAYRLLPMAFAWTLIPLLLSVVFNISGSFGTWKALYPEMLSTFSLLYNYTYLTGLGNGKLFPLWSLSVEEHFYILLPLLFVGFSKNSWRLAAALCGIIIVAFLIRPFSDPAKGLLYMRMATQNRLDSLFAGVVLALLRERGWGLAWQNAALFQPGKAVRYLPYVLIFLLWMLPGSLPPAISHQQGFVVFWTIGFVLVGMASLERGMILNIPGIKSALEYLGSRSYGIYLIHMPVSYIYDEIFYRWGAAMGLTSRGIWTDLVSSLIPLSILLILAEVSYRFLEKPFMRIGYAEKAKPAVLALPEAA